MTPDLHPVFLRVRAALAPAIGMDRALTLEDLAERAEASRRDVEHVMETCFLDFGFPLVSGSAGYWQPTQADEINRYAASLRSRALKCFLRARRAVSAARRGGWPMQGRTFFNPPARQGELDLINQTKGNP